MMTDRTPMKTRDEVREKVAWEGGLAAALEYGLTEEDMPEGDSELRKAWRRLRNAFLVAEELGQDVERLIGNIR